MEGPTPVSALIHAATMVAAGAFLVARVYPLMSAHTGIANLLTTSTALQAVTWIGSITALYGAIIAVAQYDIKRILAYSTISQLGYMMMGLGVGGVAVGMFHLITHAFFKSLLFLGAGSVIHGCSGEQDIRRMGGLGKLCPSPSRRMPWPCWRCADFHSSSPGSGARTRFFTPRTTGTSLKLRSTWVHLRALLTAFYMSRQVFYVFSGTRVWLKKATISALCSPWRPRPPWIEHTHMRALRS